MTLKYSRELLAIGISLIFVASSPVSVLAADDSYCNCVVFRLDNLQDYYVNTVQVAVLDQFTQRNQPFSLGPILIGFGDDNLVVNKALEGYESGLFEVAVHGWNHNDFSQETLATQMSDLQLAQDKVIEIFGDNSKGIDMGYFFTGQSLFVTSQN